MSQGLLSPSRQRARNCLREREKAPAAALMSMLVNFERKFHLQYRPGVVSDLD
jgi:hypothetical protein